MPTRVFFSIDEYNVTKGTVGNFSSAFSIHFLIGFTVFAVQTKNANEKSCLTSATGYKKVKNSILFSSQ